MGNAAWSACLVCCIAVACASPPAADNKSAPNAGSSAPQKDSPEQDAAPADPEAPAEQAEGAAAAPEGAPAKGVSAEKAAPLTEEEIWLIEQDPKGLEPEQRRKRAYALRKKIMQNPDSPAAQALRKAAEDILKQQQQGQQGSAPDLEHR